MDAQMLKACMTYHGKTQEDVGKAIGVDRSTFWRRMNDGDFRMSQIYKMMEYVPLTLEEVESIFFPTKK